MALEHRRLTADGELPTDVVGAAHLPVAYHRLRLTGSRNAARNLINALGSPVEDLQSLAGMFLVRAGRRSVPELMNAIAERHPQLPTCLLVLADIGGEDAKPALMRFADDPDPTVARAARDGLSTLAMREKMESGESPFTPDGLA
jgi:HEAT repeat protein